jgi:uncharacterized membrane protein YjgN (DUF898 family)
MGAPEADREGVEGGGPLAPAGAGEPPVSGVRLGRRLYFYGSPGGLFTVQIVGTLFTLLTLGVYHFWAKARVLRYIASQTELDGDRFTYHGTGRELFFGFLKAIALFAVPLLLLKGVPLVDPSFELVVGAALLGYGLIYFVMIPLAMVGSRRYRLGRTSWRGVRFGFRGSGRELIRLFVRDTGLILVTLGVYYPWFAVRRHRFMVSNAYFGSEPFRFDGEGRDLLGAYARLVLFGPLTVGAYWFWFQARRHRYLWRHTTILTMRFDTAVTGGALLRLRLANAGLLLATLGFGLAWVRVRNARFLCRNLRLVGELDPGAVRQIRALGIPGGEGLTDLVGAGFELGW